jgi:hypothetical protein
VKAVAPADDDGVDTGDELRALDYLRAFLSGAVVRGLLDRRSFDALVEEIEARRWVLMATAPQQGVLAGAIVTVPPPPVPVFPEVPVPPAVTFAPPPPPPPLVPAAPSSPPRPPAEPLLSPIARQTHLVRELIASDIALHGLAYLGVLLTFAGTLGFVFFAFGRVDVGLRPVAELAIPIVLFGSSWFLRRRGTPFVAGSVELLGGGLLPVVLFASFLDGANVPGDLHGSAKIAVLTIVALGLAAIYGLVARRRPSTTLRYLVGLMVWTAAGVIGFGLRQERSAGQMAVVTGAIAATLLVARLRSGHRLSRPTELAAVPGTALAYSLALLFGGAEGWPAAEVAGTGIAALAAAEFLAAAFDDDRVVPFAQTAVVALTALALAPGLGAGWAGAAAVVGFLAVFERQERRRPLPELVPVAGVGGLLALVASLGDPWPALAGWGLAGAWAHARRIRPSSSIPPGRWMDMAAAVLPAGAASGLIRLLPNDIALAGIATAVAAGAGAARLLGARDPFWRRWLAASGSVLGLAVLAEWSASHLAPSGTPAPTAPLLAVAAALVAITLAFAVDHPALAVWASAAAAAEAMVLALSATTLSENESAMAWAFAGLVAVIVATAWSRRPAGHVAAVGHLTGLAILGVSVPDDTRLILIAASSVGWAITLVATEVGRSEFANILERILAGLVPDDGGIARFGAVAVPSAALLIEFAALAATAAERWGLTDGRREAMGPVLAAVAVAYAVAARLLRHRRPLGPIVAVGGVALAAVAIATATPVPLPEPVPWEPIAALAASIAVVAIIGRDLRHPAMRAFGWAMTLPLALGLANRAGVPAGALQYVSLVYGGVLVVGGLLVDDLLAGRRRPGRALRTRELADPVILGALAVPASLAVAFTDPPDVYGWWSLGAAILFFVVGVQMRAGGLGVPAWSLAAAGAAAISPWPVTRDPWLFVPAAALLVAASAAARRWLPAPGDPLFGWDLPPLLVAHGVAVAGLAMAPAAGAVVPVSAGLGALSLVVATWRRHWAWAAAGTALVLIGAEAAGHGWFALALAATAAGAAAASSRLTGPVRVALQAVSLAAAGAAWGEALAWRGTSRGQIVVATALASGGVALLAMAIVRLRPEARDWSVGLGTLAATGLATAASLAPFSGHRPAWSAVAAATGLFAVAAGGSARPLDRPELRFASAVLVLAAGAALIPAYRPPDPVLVGAPVGAALGAMLGALVLWRLRPASPSLAPLTLFAVLADAAAAAVAGSALPRRTPLEAVLLAAAVESAAAGLILGRPRLLHASPPLLCGAWLLFASEALRGDPQWFTAPIGLTLLAVVELARWNRRREHAPVVDERLLAAEVLGIAFLAGASLVQTVVEGATNGMVAVLIGIAVSAWGVLTRVRRRVYAGVGVTVLSVFLMVAVPLARVIPEVRGPALWATLAAIGVALIVIATTLEQGRARLQATIRRLGELMAGWE